MGKFRLMLVIGLLALCAGMFGCSGDDGKDGSSADTAALEAQIVDLQTQISALEAELATTSDAATVAELQSQIADLNEQLADVEASLDSGLTPITFEDAPVNQCEYCHANAGDAHQDIYDSTTDTSYVLAFTGSTATSNGDGTFTNVVTFTVTKNGVPYADTVSSNKLASMGTQSWNILTFDSATNTVERAMLGEAPFSYTLATTETAGTYTLTSTLNYDLNTIDGFVYGYVAIDKVGPSVSHIQLYDNVTNAALKFGDWDYVSNADVVSCENCHGTPYGKHGYRQAVVAGLPDFVACKACHYDSRAGSDGIEFFGVEDHEYIANVMTDVHASHLNLFPYPQDMNNCVACHIGTKVDTTLAQENMELDVCLSCHADVPEDGIVDRPWSTILPTSHINVETTTLKCSDCHDGSWQDTFAQMHNNGYNPLIYTTDGVRYSEAFTVSIDSVSLTGDVLDIKFSATENEAVADLAVTDIVPTVMVSLYGYDTKDYIISSHTRDTNSLRMEKTIGTANALFTEVATGVDGSWEVTLDLSAYASTPTLPDMIADSTVKRLEVGVMPTLVNVDGDTLGLDAPSKTFDVTTNEFVDYYSPIVGVEKCNACHDQLATTFHSGDRGGSITVCRMCHVTTSGASHLEMQSRSLDSYVHAIHSMQQFDPGDIDWTDEEAVAEYNEEIGFVYPMFTTLACESCHYEGTYNLPDTSKSLPGLLSASDTNADWDRAIGSVPMYVTDAATRACGGCHRAQMINADEAGALQAFYDHTATFGTTISTNSTDATSDLNTVIEETMAPFK